MVYTIRKTEPGDIQDILSIYQKARDFMAASGNPSQWTGGYPGLPDLEQDMAQGASYVCIQNDIVVATFYFKIGDEPGYHMIRNGHWINEETYGVVHRIAAAFPGKGIASFCLDWCLKQWGNIRIDTHRDNLPMQSLLKKKGFSKCGIVLAGDGSERIAYQKSLWPAD